MAAAEANKKEAIENYLKAQKAVCEGNQAASTQMVKDVAGTGLNFVPIVGDIKGFVEAQTAMDYLAAAIGVILGADNVAGKAIKAAEASKLIDKASNEVYATLLMGSKSNPMIQPSNPSYQPVRDLPGTISNREYSGHALDRMQDRGITPSVVENTIKNGKINT